MRTLDDWFAGYATDSGSPVRGTVHAACASAAALAVLAMLWALPSPAPQWFRPGVWAVLAMFPAYGFYHRLSRNLAYAMALTLVAGGVLAWALYGLLGPRRLFACAAAVFVAAAIGAGAMRAPAGRARSVAEVPAQLLVAPAWLMARWLRQLGIPY